MILHVACVQLMIDYFRCINCGRGGGSRTLETWLCYDVLALIYDALQFFNSVTWKIFFGPKLSR